MKKEKSKPHWAVIVLFILYLLLLFYLLFFSETYGRTIEEQGYRYNLELFKEIRRFWDNRNSLGWRNVMINLGGNIAAFVPFGFFLPMLCRAGKNVFGSTVISALFSLLVETVQLITRVGAFDVDDIFLNALGGLAGWVVYSVLWKPLTKK